MLGGMFVLRRYLKLKEWKKLPRESVQWAHSCRCEEGSLRKAHKARGAQAGEKEDLTAEAGSSLTHTHSHRGSGGLSETP